jgi:hypothetical protein
VHRLADAPVEVGEGQLSAAGQQYRIVRIVRTPSSEIHLVWRGETRIAQLDVHYAQDIVHATLVVEVDLSTEAEEELVAAIDGDVISSYLPSFDREDFLLTVFRGNEVRSYSDNQNAGEESEFPE